MIDVAERGFAERPQRLARHYQHVPAQDLLDPHALGRDLLVRRGVLAERKQRRVLVGRNGGWIGDGGGGVHGELTGLGAGSVCFEIARRASNFSTHFCEKWKLPDVSPGAVMPALVAGIHVFLLCIWHKDVDGGGGPRPGKTKSPACKDTRLSSTLWDP